jgi:hypothetical protein
MQNRLPHFQFHLGQLQNVVEIILGHAQESQENILEVMVQTKVNR